MIALGIVFLILFTFGWICLFSVLVDIERNLKLSNRRYDEIIRVLKK